MSDERGVLFDQAILGEQVDQFLRTEVGQFLMDHIDAEIEAAIDALKTVDPTDVKAVMKCQNAVWRAESMKTWLNGIILQGLRATEILEERDE